MAQTIKAIAAEHKRNKSIFYNAHLVEGNYFCPVCGNQNGNKRLLSRAALRAHYKEKHVR